LFNRKTVFILGAGASWHYGYPTGEDLVKKVIVAAENLATVFEISAMRLVQQYPKFVSQGRVDQRSVVNVVRGQWRAARDKCRDIANRLRVVNPLVVDYFLGQNPSVQEVGKLLVCWVIMESEEIYLAEGANANRRKAFEWSPLKHDRDCTSGLDITKYKDGWYRFILHKLVTGCIEGTNLRRNNGNYSPWVTTPAVGV
jgi:hypothetical protein